MKLWTNEPAAQAAGIDAFTTGKDREMDMYLALYDVYGSMAHAHMLQSIALLTAHENAALQQGLQQICREIQQGQFQISAQAEDVHSHVEALLTERLGPPGKKLHAARSRNDQVLLDIRLFLRDQLFRSAGMVATLSKLLMKLAHEHRHHLMPGYTHLQLAMPSSAGLWLGAYAESLTDDVLALQSAYKMVNQNPLGSAAGYGSSFAINRQMTTRLLGFDKLAYNVMYAQMGRGRCERNAAQALGSVAETLSRLAMDMCLFMNQHFAFISFPASLTTGSSIMPHKRNPDVWEIIRSHCNRLKALPNEIMLMTTNLPAGYHRDLQLLKEHLFPAFKTLEDCIDMCTVMLNAMEVKPNLLSHPLYQPIFTVEAVNQKVIEGMPFRDAYHAVSAEVKAGSFRFEGQINHTHEGSIGQLCLPEIEAHLQQLMDGFHYEQVETAFQNLRSPASS